MAQQACVEQEAQGIDVDHIMGFWFLAEAANTLHHFFIKHNYDGIFLPAIKYYYLLWCKSGLAFITGSIFHLSMCTYIIIEILAG